MTFADRKIFCHLIGDKSDGESAERMTAVFEAVNEWREIEFFKNSFDGLDCPNRKGLILVWLYVVWCLQCCLDFITNKTQTAEGT